MKKSILCLAMAAIMAISACASLAASAPDYAWYYATLNQRISSRTGPGTRYDDDAFTVNSIGSGTSLRIFCKSYDEPNRRWWVMTEITYRGERYRVYTGEQRFNGLNLNAVPTEYELGTCMAPSGGISSAYAGPGGGYHRMPRVPAYTQCTIWGYEDNASEGTSYIMVEYYDSSSRCYRRCWCPEWAVDSEYMYYGWPSAGQSYPSYPSLPSYPSTPSYPSAPSYPSGETASSWPQGSTCRIHAESGRVRTGPGVSYAEAGYIYRGQEYTILEVRMGDTGKDWYRIRGDFNGGTAWVSSGLVTVWLNGSSYDNGTANGWPIY